MAPASGCLPGMLPGVMGVSLRPETQTQKSSLVGGLGVACALAPKASRKTRNKDTETPKAESTRVNVPSLRGAIVFITWDLMG